MKEWHKTAKELAETFKAEGYAFEAFMLLRLIEVDTEIAAAFDMKEAAHE